MRSTCPMILPRIGQAIGQTRRLCRACRGAAVGDSRTASRLVRYWEQNPNSDVILLYLESFGSPRRFSRIARRVARVKPIVAVKSGRSPVGARATGSHTGALIAASDVTVDALFRQAGVIRTDTLEEMFD